MDKMIEANDRVYKHVAIEMYHGYGKAIDEDSRLTLLTIGRLVQIGLQNNKCKVTLMFRKNHVAKHLCFSMNAGDPEINAVLRDIYGKPGTKNDQGILYGIKSHAWAALAVATAWEDQYPTGELGSVTLCPDGTWEDQKTRDEITAVRRQKQSTKAKLTREKNRLAEELEQEFLEYNIEQHKSDWTNRAGA